MSTSLDVDIAALVGEMEAVPCEHHQHGVSPAHSDEPASHYGQSQCAHCMEDAVIAAICPGYVAAVRSGRPLQCPGCKRVAPAFEFITILGAVGGSK